MAKITAAKIAQLLLVGGLVLTLAACVERIRSHGYVPPEDDLDQITVGVDTRDTVTEVLGAPTTSGLTDDSGFYYVRSLVRHIGPIEPKVIEREIVAVTFDDGGIVQNIERFGLEQGRAVVISRRVTTNETGGNGILQQLLRNIGSFGPSVGDSL
ncbi:outer membrane protein assembly factor BamE [Pseudooceanicola sp. MF1-13]|uniref:outer membrane protein assembly factor BamE n=1 Tax=Pseudooceanicola sp. MF1-13 TaxID=3379095 RepID=UPI003892C0FB